MQAGNKKQHMAAIVSSLFFIMASVLDVGKNFCLLYSENEFKDIRIFYPLNNDILLILSKSSADNLKPSYNH
jgi:hypothetical protein